MMTADEYIAKATWLADMHALSGPTEHTRRAIEEHAMTAIRRNKEVREMLEEEAERAGDLAARLAESERCRGALMEELENIATAEWRTFDPDTRRCAYEFVLWAQSRARHTLNRVLSGDVTAPLPEDVRLVQVGPCSCSDHECGECMHPAPKVGDGSTARPPTPTGWSDTDWIKHLQEQQHPLAGLHINQGSMDAAADAYEAEYNARHNA